MEWVEDCNGESLASFSAGKRKIRPKRYEFIGWGSRQLMEFLESIGEDTSNEISQHDVTNIINRYVADKDLIHPTKKKRIVCDDGLFSVFEKKTISRNKVHELLERHYADNKVDSCFDFLYGSDDEQQSSPCTKKRVYQKKEVVPKSSFAAIISDNIKLVYLRRSLVQELVKAHETFEGKLVGSYVKIKSDPNDYLQKNPYQLVQVTGVTKNGSEDFLQVTDHRKTVSILLLSDDNFSQEEIEDLRARVKNGCLKKPTVVEMEEKVRSLHEDVTKHWLERELKSLQRLIDQANEKGWRKEMFEYLEKRDLLKTPEEQSRLLREVPEVIGEELEVAPKEHVGDEEEAENGFVIPPTLEAHQSMKEQQEKDNLLSPSLHGAVDTPKLDNGKEKQNDDCCFISNLRASGEVQTLHLVPNGNLPISNTLTVAGEINGSQAKSNPPEVIELSDSEDEDNEGKIKDPGSGNDEKWFYKDPQGQTRGPFSLVSLKEWSDAGYFAPDFKVWAKEHSQKLLLTSVLERLGDGLL